MAIGFLIILMASCYWVGKTPVFFLNPNPGGFLGFIGFFGFFGFFGFYWVVLNFVLLNSFFLPIFGLFKNLMPDN
jgi:hypothetical protein